MSARHTPGPAGRDAALLEQCDPYGSMEFAIGSETDFVCFDYAVDATREPLRVALCATVNSETGRFIQDFAPGFVGGAKEAVTHARRLVSDALDWCSGDPDTPIRLDMKGWGQDPTYFVRAVENAVSPNPTRVKRRVRDWRRYL